jgi:hypothetical protein
MCPCVRALAAARQLRVQPILSDCAMLAADDTDVALNRRIRIVYLALID